MEKNPKVPAKLAKEYLNLLRIYGGPELVKAGKTVLMDIRAGKKVKLPKGRRRPTQSRSKGLYIVSGAPIIRDPQAAVDTAACIAGCLKLGNPWYVAGCIALCLGLGVPRI